MASEASMQNNSYRAEYLRIIDGLNGDEAGRRLAWERMGSGECYYHGLPVAFSYNPQLFGAASRARLQETAALVYRILAKVIEHYRADPAYRKEFRFDPRVEQLVLLPTAYDAPIPFARIDCMYDEKTDSLVFCEFNTDASSGMYENVEALASISCGEAYRRFTAAHRVQSDVEQHFDGWVRTFLRIREEALTRRESASQAAQAAQAAQAVATASRTPHMAIAVCFDSPNPELGELREYCARFETAGLPCSVFDVREFEFDGTSLIGRHALIGQSDVAIDSIWRYAIVVDLLEHWNDVQGFIEGIRADAAVMIGGFSTQIVHDKQLFSVLHRPATQAFLSPEEQRFVRESIPFTTFLNDPQLDLDDVRAHLEKWIVKPADWYASINVAHGGGCTPDEWQARIDACLACDGGSPWLAQEFHAPYKTPAIALYGREEEFTAPPCDFGNIIGLYLFDGQFSGVYVRQGPHGVIGSAREGLVSPVLWVDCPAQGPAPDPAQGPTQDPTQGTAPSA